MDGIELGWRFCSRLAKRRVFVESDSQDGSFSSKHGQRYSASGVVLGDEFQVNSFTFNNQLEPCVAVGSQGDFAAVWASQRSVVDDFAQLSVQVQRFASDATSLGEQFQVNMFTTFDQRNPRPAFGAEDDFVITWASGNNVSGDGPDGFESGDVSTWSGTQ